MNFGHCTYSSLADALGTKNWTLFLFSFYVPYSGKIFEGEDFRESYEQEDFVEKTFADSYYRPNIGCAYMRCSRRKLSRTGLDSRKFPAIRYVL